MLRAIFKKEAFARVLPPLAWAAAGSAATVLFGAVLFSSRADVNVAARPALRTVDAPVPMPIWSDEQAKDFDAAIEMFHAARWAPAFGIFASLADDGHPDAARMALFMLYYGEALFGSAWSARTDQIARWRTVAADAPVLRDMTGAD